MTTNQILFGLGLVLILAVGSQVVARRVRLAHVSTDAQGSEHDETGRGQAS